MSGMTPQEIVHELDKYIVGQGRAKRAVAIALRNRWRRQQVAEPLRQEITPKNILMIGPTGVGKTEIARRLANLANAPFIKVEATKFTEVGYVGKDVDTIVRDLIDVSVKQERETQMRFLRARAHAAHRLLAGLLDADLDQVAHDGVDVAAHVAHLGELGGLHLDERRVGEAREPARDLGLAHAGRPDHQDVLGRDFLA